MRAAIKTGNFKKVRNLFSRASFAPQQLLAMATCNYNTVQKHSGHTDIVDFLIARGATPSSEILFEAVRDGNQSIVDRLVAAGVELDIFACSLIGNVPGVKKHLRRDRRLARSRTPREFMHYRDFTPLHCCCLSGLGRQSQSKEAQLLEVGKVLVNFGADTEAKGTFYGSLTVTPLDMAAHTGGNLPLSRFLIANGAKISSFAFSEALAHRGRSFEEGVALAKLFLEMGFDINTGAAKGTALHGFANAGALTAVKWLIEHGADVNARGRMGRTPLHLAAERNMSSTIVEVLVKCGADTNAKDDQGLTALDVAAFHGKTAVLRWLKNAQINTSST